MDQEKHDDYNKLLWNSRRGMLELDVILLPFSQKIYPTLSSESQSIYWELLGCEDQDLFSWFMRRNQPSSTQLMTMVDMVLNNVKPA